MKHLPVAERPRERLSRLGAEALSTPELLALLLNTGTTAQPVLQLATELLKRFSSLQALGQATVAELTQIGGIGPAKALRLKAAFALAARLAHMPPLATLDSPEAAARHLLPHLSRKDGPYGLRRHE